MAYVCRSVVQQKLTRMKCNFHWMTEPPDEFHTELINTVHNEAIHHRAGWLQWVCNMAQTSNTAAEEVAQLHDTVGASMVTILWQPTWMWFSRIFCLFFFFLHFLQTLTGSTGATNSLQLFCDSFQGQFVRIFNVCSLGETYLAFLFRSLAFLLRVRWTDRFNSHVCRLKVQNVCEEI